MDLLIIYMATALIAFSQLILYIWMMMEFRDVKKELIKSGKIEFRNFTEKLTNQLIKDDDDDD